MFNNHFFKTFILSLFVGGIVFVQTPVATEANPLPGSTFNAIAVTTTADVINPADGVCSLREAIISANTNPFSGGDVEGECQKGSDTLTDRIYLLSGETYFLTLPGSLESEAKTGDLDVLDNTARLDIEIVVSGDTTNRSIIDALGLGDRVFHVLGASISFNDLVLKNGEGGIRNTSGTIDLLNTSISHMSTTSGGGIYNNSGTINLEDSNISLNAATMYGGGIYNGPNGVINLSSSTVFTNEASFLGGGIYNRGIVTTADGSKISGNLASEGGGILNDAGVLNGSDLTIFFNEATIVGGGIVNRYDGEIDLENLTLVENYAGDQASGIFNAEGGTATLKSSGISGHVSNSGIFNQGDFNLIDVDIYDNIGGGIISKGGEVMLLRTQVYDNRNQSGGGINLSAGAKAAIHQSAIYGNVATASGGGISATGSSFEMANTTVSGNATEIGIGGGIHLHSGFEGESIRFYNVTVADNSAKDGSALSFISKNIDIQIVNTILTGPEDQTVCQNGTVQSKGHNIVSDESCLDGLETGDLIASPLLKAFEKIDNTLGHRPEFDSPAFGNGDSAVCAAAPVSGVDQRGLAREFGCDIGAIELLQAPPTVTETPEPSETPITTATPKPSETPVATATPKPGETPVATATAKPSETPEPGTGESAYRLFLPLVEKN